MHSIRKLPKNDYEKYTRMSMVFFLDFEQTSWWESVLLLTCKKLTRKLVNLLASEERKAKRWFFFFCKNPLPKVPPFTFLVQKLQNKPTSLRGDEIKPNDRADHSQNQNLNFLFQNLEESLLKMISSEKDQNRKSVLPSTSRNSPKRWCPFT